MFKNYELYLSQINSKLEDFFERQKPYIHCKKGCAKCCKNSEFPYTRLEITYLLNGFLTLDDETKQKIENNILKTVEEKKNFKGGGKFRYDCPFLIDDICSVYPYRGVLCRTFGLLSNDPKTGKIRAPFCSHEGLNYSCFSDPETKTFSAEKIRDNKIDVDPLIFNIDYLMLTDSDFEKCFNIKFGERKALIDWFIVDDNKDKTNAS